MTRKKQPKPNDPVAGAYLLPEEAYYHLQCVRDDLRLFALLAAPRQHGERESDFLSVPLGALSHCFRRTSDQLDEALRRTRWRAGVDD